MSSTKPKHLGTWPSPPTNPRTANRLTGRVIVGLLTGSEDPEPPVAPDVVTSAKERRR